MPFSFSGRTILITGASRGIGKAIALKLAAEGANIIIAAKSVTEDPRLGGTIYSAAEEIEKAGGHALAVACDIRLEDQVKAAVEKGAERFGGLDMLVNNASAISLTSVADTEPKRFDLMYDINVRGTFFVTQACLPFLSQSDHAHVLTLSPPLNMDMKWFVPHPAYTISKYDMTLIAMSIAAQFKGKIASNALWPKTVIATAAIRNLPGGENLYSCSRHPSIVADAAYHILKREITACSGNCFIDEDVLKEEGISDLNHYAVDPSQPLIPDFFI